MSIQTLSAAIAVLPLGLVAMAMGSIFNKAIESVGRNPESGEAVKKLAILGFSVVESVALLAFVVAILILFK